MTLNCLANDWKKDEYRYSLELSKSKTPQNTILVVGVNPGGQTDPEEQYFGSTIRRVCKLVINNGEGNTTYDSVLFVNLTPVIAKAPSSLKDTASIEPLPKDNIKEIKSLIQERNGRIHNVLFCFGNSFKYSKELFSKVIRAIEEALPPSKYNYWCLGISKKGYPVHPLAHMKDLKLTECTFSQITPDDYSFQKKN